MSRVSPDGGCPDEDDVAAFLRGRLLRDDAHDLQAHVSRCVPCRVLLATLARAQLAGSRATADSVSPTLPLDSDAGDADLPAGAQIGRYVVLERRGAGGMGVVYAVHDPELNREVALKLLHADGSGPADRLTIRDRLVREAQAMARVAHPNVVTVFEVGSVGDRVFLAMELVRGQTLDEWRRAARRDVSEILAVFVAAGKGLAAAHAAGLVHRDFKPTNVLVGDDGRVRVTDFGVARAAHAAPVRPTPEGAAEAGSEASVTGTGVAGTLAYMAPEQYLGRPADARADQFSFAVALYEALHGTRPFELCQLAGPGGDALGPPAPRGSDLPLAVHRVLRRALCADPGGRYPSVTELLTELVTALAPQARPWRGRAIIAAAAVLVALAIAYVVHLQRSAERRTELVGWLHGLVPEMRTLLRSERMLPLHDIGSARSTVRSTLRTVERVLETTAGDTGRALAMFVLGEGARALGDHARALTWLEAAWEAGERGPHIDAALGDVLGATYETQREQLEQTTPPAGREAGLRAIEKRYRDPAMAHLRAALGARDASPAYLEALIAFHDHRFAEAIQRAHAAFAESPRFYEAGQLEARAHHEAGYERAAAGQDASAEFATARRLFEKVLEIARSDDSAWLAYAAMLQTQIAVVGERDGELEHQALAALRNGQAIDPDSWRALLREAEILLQRGNVAILLYRDPSADVDRALALIAQARAHGAGSVAVDPLVCVAQWERARDQGVHGVDPRAAFAQAVTACQAAAATQPTADNFDTLGIVYSSLADYEGSHGADPAGLRELADRNLRAALAIDDSQGHHYNLGRLWVQTAQQQAARGLDPGRAVDQALVEFEATLNRHSSRLSAWGDIASALVSRAWFQRQAHDDAQPTLEQARVAVERALARSAPTNAAPIRYRILIAELEAEGLLARNADPSTVVQRIRSDVDILLGGGPRDSFPHRLACRTELIAARWALAHHGAVDPLLRRATDAAARATENDAMDALAWTARAEVELVRGEAARARGRAPRASDVASGLAFIEHAMKIDPRLIDTLHVRDELERQATIARAP